MVGGIERGGTFLILRIAYIPNLSVVQSLVK